MDKRILGGIGCITIGIGVVLVPFVREYRADQQRQEILRQWRQEMSRIGSGEEMSPEPENHADHVTDTGKNSEGAVRILRIPAIDLEAPILEGADKQNLSVSVATVEPTGTPGADGNFVIAGHNSRTYNRHFNRLEEVKSGDKLYVDTDTGNYTYIVTDIYVVEPDEVWVLDHTIEEPEITLITCYYPEKGETQRLVVKGILQ